MPSKRSILGGLGTGFVASLAGCLTLQTTTGVVERKEIHASVPGSRGEPVDMALAVLTSGPDKWVTGEYADIVSEAVEESSISVSETTHNRLTNRFANVSYYTNIIPSDSPNPANGLLSRTAFNRLSIGGSASVVPYMKPVDRNSSVGHLWLRKASPRETPPSDVKISQYDWEERASRRN